MKEYISKSSLETVEIAKKIALNLKRGDVIAFKGGLGAGKTTFVRGLTEGLSICADVSSPTFSLVHEYRGDNVTLYHFDMYRIDNIDDLYSTGFFDYLDLNQIIAIEWSENIAQFLGDEIITIEIDPIDENTRKITIYGGDRF